MGRPRNIEVGPSSGRTIDVQIALCFIGIVGRGPKAQQYTTREARRIIRPSGGIIDVQMAPAIHSLHSLRVSEDFVAGRVEAKPFSSMALVVLHRVFDLIPGSLPVRVCFARAPIPPPPVVPRAIRHWGQSPFEILATLMAAQFSNLL
jgi:hypothetical protein